MAILQGEKTGVKKWQAASLIAGQAEASPLPQATSLAMLSCKISARSQAGLPLS